MDRLRIQTNTGVFDALAAGPARGREVLLLHGFPESSAEWEYQLNELGNAGYRAVAPDQRGYSPDVRPMQVAACRLDRMVGDVLAIAESLGWQEFDLVGHDWGAAVGWSTAAASPDVVRTLCALSIPHGAALRAALRESDDQRSRFAYQELFRQEGKAEEVLLASNAARLRNIYQGHVPPARIEQYVSRLSQPGALTAALNWYRAESINSPAPIKVPTLYVWSTGDDAVGHTAAVRANEWVTGPYRFEILENISHWIPEEAPEVCTEMLLEHLEAHPP